MNEMFFSVYFSMHKKEWESIPQEHVNDLMESGKQITPTAISRSITFFKNILGDKHKDTTAKS